MKMNFNEAQQVIRSSSPDTSNDQSDIILGVKVYNSIKRNTLIKFCGWTDCQKSMAASTTTKFKGGQSGMNTAQQIYNDIIKAT